MNILICGAGVIGAATAHYLAARGADVTLVERLHPACAASGKSAGFLARDWCEGSMQDALARLSFDLHSTLADTLPDDYGYRRLETLQVGSSERRDLSGLARNAGTGDASWLAEDCVRGGLLGNAQSTAQIHPRRFTESLVASAIANGAALRIGTVEGLLTSNDGSVVRGVVVDGVQLQADAVVIAMGPWSAGLGEVLGLPPIGGLKGYSITLRPAQSLPAQALFVDYELGNGERPSPELVTRPDGEVYLCGLSDDDALPIDPADVLVDEGKCATLARIAARLAPALADAEVTTRQACYRPICADAMPLIGKTPLLERAYVATGHNCWGMLNAPGTGLAMSELLLDGAASAVDLAPLDPARPSCQVRA